MCGINGIITKNESSPEKLESALVKMNNLIVHRGPDDDGFVTISNSTYSVGMAMRRLSIIDLHTGKQPKYSHDKQIVIVFNGEIYNYQILRKQLEKEGVSFSTTSDTEVILKLYEQEGPSSFAKLDGMFAFSILDKRIDKLFIARDYFGEKPLYYTNQGGIFLWASELKSIMKVIDRRPEISAKGLNLFFRLTYIPAPHSIYDGIHKLEADHYIEYDLVKHTTNKFPISSKSPSDTLDISFDEAKKTVREKVYNSVESRSVSDVPLGTFLSGGVDSSIVSLCLSQATGKRIETFSIGFKKTRFDETDKSRLVAKLINSNHHEFVIDEEDLKHSIHDILVNFDEPFSDTAALPTHLVSQKTRDYVTVALTGDGGDEVFGGYNKYYIGKMNRRYTNVVPKGLHKALKKIAFPLLTTQDDNRGRRFKIKKLLNTIDYEGQFYWDIISLANTKRQLQGLLQPHFINEDLFGEYKERLGMDKPVSLTDFRQVDRLLSLDGGMLAKVDRTSMMNSLECRAPFLNRNLWEFTNSLPENYLMKGWNKKYILKEAFRDQFPENFLERRKSGFGSPVGDWLRLSLRSELEGYIDSKLLHQQGIFQPEPITRLVKEHLSGKHDNTFSVWAFYCFQKWYVNTYLGI